MIKNSKKLLLICYVAVFALSVSVCLYSFAFDRIMRLTGEVQEQRYTVDDFELIAAEINSDGTLTSTTSDPRMIMKDAPERILRLEFEAEFINMDPGELTLFYKSKEGMEEFDVNDRIWAKTDDVGNYYFDLPRSKHYGIRVDPGIYQGINVDIDGININEKQSIISFFTPDNSWILTMIIAPALIASVIKYLTAVAEIAMAKFGGKR